MNMIYYIETNLICIVMLSLFGNRSSKRANQQSSLNIIFDWITTVTILFCANDMIAAVFRGATFAGARTILSVSNWVYFEALAIISYLWLIYVEIFTNGKRFHGRKKYWLLAPLIIYTVVALTNFTTGFLFVIDENGLYVRGGGVMVHWVITWGYFFAATYKAVMAYIKEKSSLRRQNIKPLICFFIAPLVASTVQMIFYGVTSTQVGITISIVMIYIATQNASVLTDPLTGLNNRRGLANYLDRYLESRSTRSLTFKMIDINGFKGINDHYGHIVGDQILTEIANALKSVCAKTTNSIFLCRYGGDEFLIAEIDEQKDQELSLQQAIHEAVSALEEKVPCPVTVSIGSAYGVCSTSDTIKALLNQADQSMYAEKAKCKSKRTSNIK